MIARIEDIDVYYECFGEGMPILMLHGWGPDHRILKQSMEPIFGHFPFAFRRIYFDLPGMGRTKGADWIDELLGGEDRKYFEPISVRQTADVLFRFREEILPGLQAADFDFLGGKPGKAVPFSREVDDPGKRYGFPALFLTGRQDSSVGYSDLWKILELYPRASFCVLDKAGHNLQLEQSELFSALAREWLERVLHEAGAGKRGG